VNAVAFVAIAALLRLAVASFVWLRPRPVPGRAILKVGLTVVLVTAIAALAITVYVAFVTQPATMATY
jgi:hypothetical protein